MTSEQEQCNAEKCSGELSPCANGTQNRVINSAKDCKKRLEERKES